MQGLEAIVALRNKVEELSRQLDDHVLVQDIVRENESVVLELNTQNQLYDKGINSLGIDISSYAPYKQVTVRIKRGKGQPFNRVTLRDTGDFHRSFYVELFPDSFSIQSTSVLTRELVKKYGDSIFGLTDDNIGYLSEIIILPSLLSRIKILLL